MRNLITNADPPAATKAFGSWVYESCSYDKRGRVTGITLKNSSGTALRTQGYGYNDASKIVSHTVNGVATSYGYDAIGQLLSETRTGYAGAYSYDSNGNRATRTVNGVVETYAVDAGDKLLTVSVGGSAIKTFGYDAAGRTTSVVTSSGTTNLTYDFESRATSISGPGVSQTNSYNALDTRVGSTTNSASQTYLRDGAYVTDAVLSDGSATYTPGVSERRGSTTTFLHSGLKNAEAQTSTAQALTASKTYDAFGNLAASSGTWQGPFGYGGGFGYQEDTTGLKLLGHRYYDSSTGRFLTRDPIKDGRNWYTYCGNDPVGNADSNGLNEFSVFGGKVAVLGNLDSNVDLYVHGDTGSYKLSRHPWYMDVDYLVNVDYGTGQITVWKVRNLSLVTVDSTGYIYPIWQQLGPYPTATLYTANHDLEPPGECDVIQALDSKFNLRIGCIAHTDPSPGGIMPGSTWDQVLRYKTPVSSGWWQ